MSIAPKFFLVLFVLRFALICWLISEGVNYLSTEHPEIYKFLSERIHLNIEKALLFSQEAGLIIDNFDLTNKRGSAENENMNYQDNVFFNNFPKNFQRASSHWSLERF